jgi:branched-chain amino acid transport system substrate-binding protein
MKSECCNRLLRKVLGARTAVLLASLAVAAVALACQEDEGTPTPGTTPALTPAVTPAGTAAPAADVPGITETQIFLGADAPMTGALGAFYSMIPQSIKAYFAYINDTEGGVCGREIVYKVEDNGNDPAKALEAARKLVERDKVFAFVGSLGDTPHPAVWDYLNKSAVPDILVSGGVHMYGADYKGHPWTAQMIPSYRVEGTFFGRYISENMPGKKVAVLYMQTMGGTDELQGVKDGLDPNKNEIVSEQGIEPTAVSVRSEVALMKDAGAEAVVVYAEPGRIAQAIEEANRLDWDAQWFTTYSTSDEIMFQYVSPELLEGAITFQALKLAAWRDEAAVARHYALMDEYGGPVPTNFSVYAQVVAETAVEILKRSCDNLTREGLMDALHSLKDFHSDLMLDGVNVSFSETDHTGLQTGRMVRATRTDGKGSWEYFGPLVVFD